jgi:uncharacterized protein YndB with AHSA1/START domain
MTAHAPTTARSVTREIQIAAPVDAVWKALTDAEELTRWFPPRADVIPGVGGSIRMSWQNMGELDDGRIEVWDAERHLRTVGQSGSWVGIATDYHLRASAGGTVLRVVSAGFGDGASWDTLLDAFGDGWDFELRGLRHYLERHRGVARTPVWARAPYRCGHAEAWRRLTGAQGWLGPSGLGDVREGERWSATATTGERMSGTVHTCHPLHQFSGTVEELNDALLRVQLYDGTAFLWLSTYGLPPATVRTLAESWQASLRELFAH